MFCFEGVISNEQMPVFKILLPTYSSPESNLKSANTSTFFVFSEVQKIVITLCELNWNMMHVYM